MPTTERVSADLVAQKELFTAPFMMYDGSTRRIIANPRHNRLLLADLARTQATLVHLLRRARPSPVEQLHALQQSLIYVLASTSTSVEADARNTGIISVVCDAELQQHMKRLEEASMHHDMSSRGIAATAHVLSDEVCRTTLANYINAAMETTKEQQQQQQNKNASETQTLGSVLQHLEQCQRSVEEIHASYLDIHTISSSEQQQQQQSLNASSSSVASTKVVKSYYNLLTWALSLDADRRAAIPTNLQTTTTVDITRTSTPQVVAAVPTSATNTNTNTNTSAPASTPADVAMAVAEDYDPFTGKLQLTRASTDCRWGISFSEGGFIVGIHEQLRGANECGQRLHDAIQLKAATGLRVREIQRRRVGKSTTSSSPLTDILAKMKSANDELSLTVMLEKLPHVSRSSAQEVFFGEVGHKDGHPRAMLVLQRLDPHVPWGCAFALDDASRQLHLHDVSATVRLSKAAKTFIHSNKNNVVRVLHINYNDVGHLTNMAQVEGLSKSALMLALQLELTDAPTRAKEEEVAGAEAEEATTTTPMEVDGAPAAVAMDPVEEEEVVAPIEAHGDEEETAAITHKEDVQHTQLQFDDDDVDFDDVMQEIHDDDDAEKDATKEGMEGNDWAKLDADDDAPTSTVLDDDDAGASTPVVEEGDEEEGGKLPHASPVEPSGAIDSIIHDFFNTTPSATTTTALAEEAGAAAEMMSDEKGKRKRGAPKKAAEKPAKRGRRSTKVAKADDGDADVAAAEMEEEASVLPPRASAAELAFAEIQSNKNTTKATTDDAADADHNNTMEVGEEEEEPRRVPLAQLMEAAPLRFNNSICVEKFDGTTIEMTRPGVETPWEMLIAFSGSDILLTRLPPMSAAARKHPFTRALKPDADGRGRWAIDSINGKDLTLLDKRQKAQTLEMLKKSINVRLALRALPK